MSEDNLLQYLMKRFDKLEAKVDKLISHYWFHLGVAAGVGGLISFLIQVFK